MGVALFLLGEKGLTVLSAVLPHHLKAIHYVVVGSDKQIQQDYSKEIADLCDKLNLPYVIKNLSTYEAVDTIIAIGWRWLINKTLQQQLIVFHDSLLPKYRGFNPLVSALINGDTKVGATALWGGMEYDTGDIIEQTLLDITYPKKIRDAIAEMGIGYSKMANTILDKIVSNTPIEAIPQDKKLATYSLWRDNEDYFIDWNEDASKIKRMVDATGFPYTGAKFIWEGKPYILQDACDLEEVVVENRCPGKLIFKMNDRPVIVCGYGLLRLDTVIDMEGNQVNFSGKFRIRLK